MTKLTNPLKSAICNRTERFSRMRRQNAPMFVRVQQPHTAQKLTIFIQNYYKVLQNLLCLQKFQMHHHRRRDVMCNGSIHQSDGFR